MKNYIPTSLLFIIFIAGMTYTCAAEKDQKSISAESLSAIPIIGKLGLPLGKVMKVRAIVVDGDSFGTKEFSDLYLLRITEVNGIKLDTEPIVQFEVLPSSGVKLANSIFSLYELKTGKKANGLNGDQTNKLKNGYVGQSFFLQVFETGKFSGTPNNMPEDMGPWSGHGFEFRTHLMVLREAVSK